MAKIYGPLERAQLEVKTTDYSAAITGTIWWDSSTFQVKTCDGTNVRALLRNDSKAIIGNSGTSSQNIRFHRGAAGVLQLVSGADATSEGSLSTSLNQISAKLENYTDAGKPAAGNAGRLIWITDLTVLKYDTGSTWVAIAPGTTSAIYDAIVGSSAQVTAGTATHSTWASAIAAVSAGDTIKILEGSWTENVTVSKQLNIIGNGYGSYLDGTLTFNSSSDRSKLEAIRMSGDLTLDSGADLISVSDVWFAANKTFVDNGTGNVLSGFQE